MRRLPPETAAADGRRTEAESGPSADDSGRGQGAGLDTGHHLGVRSADRHCSEEACES